MKVVVIVLVVVALLFVALVVVGTGKPDGGPRDAAASTSVDRLRDLLIGPADEVEAEAGALAQGQQQRRPRGHWTTHPAILLRFRGYTPGHGPAHRSKPETPRPFSPGPPTACPNRRNARPSPRSRRDGIVAIS